MNMDYIRQRILVILDERKMTQKALAARSGVSYVALNRFLSTNRSNIGLETLLSIARGLEIPVDLLLSQRKTSSSVLLDTVVLKLEKLPENDRRQFLLPVNSLLDMYIEDKA